MSHVRTQIRDAVVTVLTGHVTVSASRLYPLAESDLPVVLVYTDDEQIDADGSAFAILERRLTLVLEVVAQATGTVDVTLDGLLATVETRMATVPTLGGVAMAVVPASIEVSASTDGSKPIGRARLTYTVLYRTSATDPTVNI